MNRWRRPLAAPALIAMVNLISACGSTAPATGSATSTGATRAVAAAAQQGVRFASCMRSNGVGAFPDPGASGRVTIDAVVNGTSVNPGSPAFKHAISACRDLEPAGFMGAKRSPRQLTASLQFARCIRANGVKDFPDPASGQPLVDTNRIPSAATSSGMSILNAAMHECGHFVAAFVRGGR